jgi:hypothetical protein
MDQLVLIPFGGEFLALTTEELALARRRGHELTPSASAVTPVACDEVLDADAMANRTAIPASWWLEQARKGNVPHMKAGKYVRFRLNETLDALRHADIRSASLKKSPAAKRFAEACYHFATEKR